MLRVSRCCQNGHDITFVANLWLCPVCLVCFGLLLFFVCSCFCFLWGWHQRPSRRAASIWRTHGVDYYSHASVSAVGCSVRFVHTVCGSQQQQQQPVQSEPVWPDRLLPLPLLLPSLLLRKHSPADSCCLTALIVTYVRKRIAATLKKMGQYYVITWKLPVLHDRFQVMTQNFILSKLRHHFNQ